MFRLMGQITECTTRKMITPGLTPKMTMTTGRIATPGSRSKTEITRLKM